MEFMAQQFKPVKLEICGRAESARRHPCLSPQKRNGRMAEFGKAPDWKSEVIGNPVQKFKSSFFRQLVRQLAVQKKIEIILACAPKTCYIIFV